ncbi:MAG: class I SAM-dependent methyltransferase [Candidatus Helarchaeota archaeon]
MKKKLLVFLKKVLHIIEPEGIPFPGSLIYNYIMKRFHIYSSMLEKISETSPIPEIKGLILDLGTGPAYLPIYIVKKNPNCKVIGMDISASMIKFANQNVQKEGLSDRILLKLGDAANIPFPDNYFDFIISTGSFHHWKHPIKSFNEIYRVLKNHGQAWIYDVSNPIPKDQFIKLCQMYSTLVVITFFLHSFSEPFYDPQKIYSMINKSSFGNGKIDNFYIFYKIQLVKLVKH